MSRQDETVFGFGDNEDPVDHPDLAGDDISSSDVNLSSRPGTDTDQSQMPSDEEGEAEDVSGLPQGLKRTFDSLHIVPFRYLWLGMLLQFAAMQMQMLARGYFVFDLTGSPSTLGIVSAAGVVPVLTFGLFGGVIADRMERGRIIQLTLVVSIVVALFIGISITTRTVTWQHLLATSVIQGFIMPLVMPARQAIIPQVVPKSRLMNAMAVNSLGIGLATLIGPAVAGGLIDLLGVDGVYYLVAGMFVLAIFFTGLVPSLLPANARAQTQASMTDDLKEGLRYVWKNKILFNLLILGIAAMLLAMPIRIYLPIFASEIFAVGAGGLGVMLSLIGLGGLGGALLIATARKVGRRGFGLGVSGMLSGGLLLGFAFVSQFAPIYWLGLVFMVLIGLMQTARMTLGNAMMLELTADEYRGRVMSIFTLSMGLMPLGALPVTVVAEFIGAPWALMVPAGLLIGLSGFVVITSAELRQAE